jgi:lipoate-protein ligase A
MSEPMRLLIDPPTEPAENMGRDQALLARVAGGAGSPTLRFYQWSPAAISLGYFQRFTEYAALGPPLGALPVVRRVTGGGAIVHADELTYSLTLPAEHRLVRSNPACLYDRVHAAIIATVRTFGIPADRRGPCNAPSHAQRGPFLCFSRAHASDVVVNGAKLAGSAQRRVRGAVLQHGSIILRRRFDEQPSAAIRGTVDLARFIDVLVRGLEAELDIESVADVWSDEAIQIAREEAARFRDPTWTQRR